VAERDPCEDRGVTDDTEPTRHLPDDSSGAVSGDVNVGGADAPDVAAADAESAYELLQRGHELLRRHHNAQAAVVLERAARLEPGKGSILEALGRAYYNSAQHERSRETFEAMLEIDPSAHYAHFALGQSLKRLGREREARAHLRLAVALSPSTAIYRSALARMPEAAPE
jgi:tetratricopeptide (TPR) repeat protein